jgi:hypothetical protein
MADDGGDDKKEKEWIKQAGFDPLVPVVGRRSILPHQAQRLQQIQESPCKCHPVNQSVGTGKSALAYEWMIQTMRRNSLAIYLIITTVDSAIATLIEQARLQGIPDKCIDILIPLKGKRKADNESKYKDFIRHGQKTPTPYHLTIIEHDHLRICADQLVEIMPSALLVIDEAHKSLYQSKRSAVMHQLARLSIGTMVMSGTWVIDGKIYRLRAWLELSIAWGPVTTDTIWAALSEIGGVVIDTGVEVIRQLVEVKRDPEMDRQYRSLLPPRLGGTNPNCSPKQLKAAVAMDYALCTTEMANQVKLWLANPENKRGVFAVAEHEKHRQQFLNAVAALHCVSEAETFNIASGKQLHLTSDLVAAKKVDPYRLVTGINKHLEGCCLDFLQCMRVGRLARVGQEAKQITDITVHTGLVTLLMNRHIDGKVLQREMNSNNATVIKCDELFAHAPAAQSTSAADTESPMKKRRLLEHA